MTTTEIRIPRALQEVWDWKEACWREVADLDLDAAIRRSLENAGKVARDTGFLPPPVRNAAPDRNDRS
jgi:hypothetical protein